VLFVSARRAASTFGRSSPNRAGHRIPAGRHEAGMHRDQVSPAVGFAHGDPPKKTVRISEAGQRPGYRLGRGELWVWCLVVVAVAYWAKVVGGTSAADPLAPAAIADSIFGAGAFNIVAWSMILKRAGQLEFESAASPSLILAALGLGLLCTVPVGPALVLALVGLGGGLLVRPNATRFGRQSGLLLLMLAVGSASPDLRPLHVFVANLDARIVAWAMHVAGANVMLRGNLIFNGTFALEVLSGCASSAPLAQVILAFVVIALYRRGACRQADAPWLLASLLASVLLTEIRLSLMAASETNYFWWHDGFGSSLYELVALAAAVVFPLIATRGARSARTTDLLAEQFA
jgi:hypothetical protein